MSSDSVSFVTHFERCSAFLVSLATIITTWLTATVLTLAVLFIRLSYTSSTTNHLEDLPIQNYHRKLPGGFRDDIERFFSPLFQTPVNQWRREQWLAFAILLIILSCLCGGCRRSLASRRRAAGTTAGTTAGGATSGFCGCLRDILLCLCCYELFCNPAGPGPDFNECCGPAYNAMIV